MPVRARLLGYVTSFKVCAVSTFAVEEGVIRLGEMNK
jgi:hypothetical protein